MAEADKPLPERVFQNHRLSEPKRAKIILDRLDLYRLLEVPEGIEIIALQVSQDPLSVQVIVTGDRLPVRPTPIHAGESSIIDIAHIMQGDGEVLPQASRIVWQDRFGNII